MSLYLRHNFNENKYHCMFQGSKVAVPLCPLALIMKFEDLTFGMDIETGVNNWRNYLENSNIDNYNSNFSNITDK